MEAIERRKPQAWAGACAQQKLCHPRRSSNRTISWLIHRPVFRHQLPRHRIQRMAAGSKAKDILATFTVSLASWPRAKRRPVLHAQGPSSAGIVNMSFKGCGTTRPWLRRYFQQSEEFIEQHTKPAGPSASQRPDQRVRAEQPNQFSSQPANTAIRGIDFNRRWPRRHLQNDLHPGSRADYIMATRLPT